MAAGDLILGEQSQGDGSLIGYAQGVSVAVPSGGTTTILTDDTASWISAVEAGNERVICASTCTFSPTSVVNPGTGSQVYTPNGSFMLDGTAVSQEFLEPEADDQFWGNIDILASKGQNLGNNPGTAVDIGSFTFSTGLYFFYVGITPFSSQFADGAEAWSLFMGNSNLTRNITLHGAYMPGAVVSGTKFMTATSSTQNTGMTNTHLTMYRGFSYGDTRNPLLGDGMDSDIVNFLQPVPVGPPNPGQLQTRRFAKVNARGNIYNGGGDTSIRNDDVNVEVYYTTSGTPSGDENLEVSSPSFIWLGSNPFATDRIGAYTGKPTPTAASASLATTLESDVAGTYPITQEEPPDTIDPISSARVAWMSFRYNGYARFFQSLVPQQQRAWLSRVRLRDPKAFYALLGWERAEPYERRWQESLFSRGQFTRYSNGFKVRDDWYRYPGLQPEVERGWAFLPPRSQFAVGGIA